jgi:hypothetical protein
VGAARLGVGGQRGGGRCGRDGGVWRAARVAVADVANQVACAPLLLRGRRVQACSAASSRPHIDSLYLEEVEYRLAELGVVVCDVGTQCLGAKAGEVFHSTRAARQRQRELARQHLKTRRCHCFGCIGGELRRVQLR